MSPISSPPLAVASWYETVACGLQGLVYAGKKTQLLAILAAACVTRPGNAAWDAACAGRTPVKLDLVSCGGSTVGYLSFVPIEKILCFCDLSVREKAWRAASQAFERMHNTLSHWVKT